MHWHSWLEIMQQYFYLQNLAIMLPSLRKINDREFSATDTKVYQPPRELSQYEPKRQPPSHESARNNPKVKVGGGFKLTGTQQDTTKVDPTKVYQNYNNYISRTLVYNQKKSSTDLNQEIKLIERKIRQCQKKIQDDKKRKIQQGRKDQQNRYDQDFEQIIRRELELQGYRHDEEKGFDYLTNPGGAPPEEQQQQQLPPEPQPQPIYSLSDGIQKLQRFYENSLKKKFERREAVHKACRKKTPKLFITHKTNTLSKVGKPLTEEEHKFRVMTKQITPQQIYPVIPNFAVVKDNLSKNIVAYLGQYKPFIDKTKEKVQKQVKASQQDIVVQNSNKSITVSN